MIQRGEVANATQQQEFSEWIKRIGEGTETVYPDHGENAIKLPDELCIGCKSGDDMMQLLEAVYGEMNSIQDWNARAGYITQRAILTPLNEDVDMKIGRAHVWTPVTQ